MMEEGHEGALASVAARVILELQDSQHVCVIG